MNVWDILLLLLIAGCVVWAVVSIRRQRKRGGCSGCSGCSGCGAQQTDRCRDCGKRPDHKQKDSD